MVYYNRGSAYYSLGKHDLAIADYDKAIELNPKSPAVYVNRGVAYDKLGNMRQAFNDYKAAARLGDKNAQDYLRNKGVVW